MRPQPRPGRPTKSPSPRPRPPPSRPAIGEGGRSPPPPFLARPLVAQQPRPPPVPLQFPPQRGAGQPAGCPEKGFNPQPTFSAPTPGGQGLAGRGPRWNSGNAALPEPPHSDKSEGQSAHRSPSDGVPSAP